MNVRRLFRFLCHVCAHERNETVFARMPQKDLTFLNICVTVKLQTIESARGTAPLTARQPAGCGKVAKAERWVAAYGKSAPVGRWVPFFVLPLTDL